MSKEIEIKYRLTHVGHSTFIEKLTEIGATFKQYLNESDTYFNVAGRESVNNRECLRVRSSKKKVEITYKPPTIPGEEKAHFAKKETNLIVNDGQQAIDLLELLGNEIVVTVNKSRTYWLLDESTITVDMLMDIGTFVEIEVESDDEESAIKEINRISHQLGFTDADINTLPYRDIVLEHQQSIMANSP